MKVRQPRASWALFLAPLAFVAASLLARALLAGAPAAISADLAQPLPVATEWHDFGRLLWAGTFGCLAVAAIPYGLCMMKSIRGEELPIGLRGILAFCALSLAAALTMPVVFSSDVYAYAGYGLLDAHGLSPYAHTPVTLSDPLYRAAVWQWSNPLPLCVYGPLFVWIAKMCVLGAISLGSAGQLFALRVVTCLALLGSGPLLFIALKNRSPRTRLAAAAGVLLNPVVIWIAAEGHNDTIVLAFVLCGFIAVRRFGLAVGSCIIAASALVKASGAAAAAVLAVFAWKPKSQFFATLGGAAIGIAITGLVARPFEAGVRTVLIPHGHYNPQFSAQFAVAQLLKTLFPTQAHAQEFGVALALVACALLAAYGTGLAVRGRLEGAAYIACALWLAIPNPYPWYALWFLPVAFLALWMPVSWAIIAASLTIFVRYLPDVSTASNADLNLAVTLFQLAAPVALLVAQAGWLRARIPLESDASA